MVRTFLPVIIPLPAFLLLVTLGLSLDNQDIMSLKDAGISDETIQLLVKEKSQETFAITAPEVVRLKRAGLSEQAIRMVITEGSFLKHSDTIVYGTSTRPLKFTTAEDIIRLKQAGISDDIIKAIIVWGSKDTNDSERARAWDMLTNMGIRVDMRGEE
jgi:hypothetical protein